MKAETKILVVEDEVEIANNLRDILAVGNYVPLLAHTPNEALEVAREHHPHLVLMDINLGADIDGITTARNILEEFSVPIVYLTAYCETETVDRAKTTAPAAYLVKPFEAKDVLTTISVGLSNYRLQCELNRRASRFELTQGNMDEGLIFIDSNGKIQSFNNPARELLGLREEEAFGADVHDVLSLVHASGRDDGAEGLDGFFEATETEGTAKVTQVVSNATGNHLSCRNLGRTSRGEFALLFMKLDVTGSAVSGSTLEEVGLNEGSFAAVLEIRHFSEFLRRFGRDAAGRIRLAYEQYVAQNCPERVTLQSRDDDFIVLLGSEAVMSSEIKNEIARLIATPMSYLLQLPTRTALLQITACSATVLPDTERGLEERIQETIQAFSSGGAKPS